MDSAGDLFLPRFLLLPLPQEIWATLLPGCCLSALHTVSHLILTTALEAGPVTLRLLAKRKPRHRKAEEPGGVSSHLSYLSHQAEAQFLTTTPHWPTATRTP